MRVMANVGGFNPLHSVMADASHPNTAMRFKWHICMMQHCVGVNFPKVLAALVALQSTLYPCDKLSLKAIVAKVCFDQCSTSRLALGSPGWLVGCLSPCPKYLIKPYNAIFF